MTSDERIPPLLHVDDMPAIRTDEDLRRHWRALMGPFGGSAHTLWVTFLQSDRYFVPVMQQIERLPALPEVGWLDELMSMCRQVDAHEPLTVAFLLSRPGSAHVSASDRAWARGLLDAARRATVRIEPIYLATGADVRILAADDLL